MAENLTDVERLAALLREADAEFDTLEIVTQIAPEDWARVMAHRLVSRGVRLADAPPAALPDWIGDEFLRESERILRAKFEAREGSPEMTAAYARGSLTMAEQVVRWWEGTGRPRWLAEGVRLPDAPPQDDVEMVPETCECPSCGCPHTTHVPVVVAAKARFGTRQGTHWEGCESVHRECAAARDRIADAVLAERIQALTAEELVPVIDAWFDPRATTDGMRAFAARAALLARLGRKPE